jgi:hypothetical protein
MKCYNHPEIEAVATCSECGKAICGLCSVDVAGKVVCQTCLASGRARSTATGAPRSGPDRMSNPLAVISVVVGVLGLLGCVCGGGIGGIIMGLPAAILGWIARKQIIENPDQADALPLANVGMYLGAAEAGVGIVLLLVLGGITGLAWISELF